MKSGLSLKLDSPSRACSSFCRLTSHDASATRFRSFARAVVATSCSSCQMYAHSRTSDPSQYIHDPLHLRSDRRRQQYDQRKGGYTTSTIAGQHTHRLHLAANLFRSKSRVRLDCICSLDPFVTLSLRLSVGSRSRSVGLAERISYIQFRILS